MSDFQRCSRSLVLVPADRSRRTPHLSIIVTTSVLYRYRGIDTYFATPSSGAVRHHQASTSYQYTKFEVAIAHIVSKIFPWVQKKIKWGT